LCHTNEYIHLQKNYNSPKGLNPETPDFRIFRIILGILLFLSLAAHGQQERVAILNTLDDSDSVSVSETAYLTDRLRETAADVLPKSRYGVMTTESIIAFLGSQERLVKECKAASCLAELGRKVNADYVAQGRIRKFGEMLSINFELYSTKSGVLVGSFNGSSKDVHGFVSIIDEKAPALFRKLESQKMHLINLVTEPPGAELSFDGESIANCPRTPCKAELREGSVRIMAALEYFRTADTTVSITAGSKAIAIRLDPIFSVLYEEPAYIDAMVADEAKPDKGSFWSKPSFWVAIALDVVGAAFVTVGIIQNADMVSGYDRYYSSGDDWEYVQDQRSSRNLCYFIGGLALASGIGVHIWF
jgi:TolB-like protein